MTRPETTVLHRCAGVLASLFGVLAAAAASAAVRGPVEALDPPALAPVEPVLLPEPELGLGDAVRLTLLHHPEIQAARQSVAARLGSLREARGLFDLTLEARPDWSYTRNELTPGTFSFEFKRRLANSESARALRKAADDLGRGVRRLTPSLACPSGIAIVVDDSGLNLTSGIPRVICVPLDGQVTLDSSLETGLEVLAGLGSGASLDEAQLELLRGINELKALGFEDRLAEQRELTEEFAFFLHRLLEETATKLEIALARLGAFPQQEQAHALGLDVSASKRFGSGILIGGGLRLDSSERNYVGKSLDPTFGGMGQSALYLTTAELRARIPLFKGRGKRQVLASSRAAARDVEVARNDLRHTMSERALRTTLAYLDLAGAQEALGFLRESAAAQRRSLELTGDLLRAGEVARTDMERAGARLSEVESSVQKAEQDLIDARFALLDAVGLTGGSASSAPIAIDGFRPPADLPVDAGKLREQAITRRRDLRAAAEVQTASEILAAAARADLRHQFDLSLAVGLTADYQSPVFLFLPEERSAEDLAKRDGTPIRYYNPAGFWRSWKTDWEPEFQLGLRFRLPFGNHAARGRLLQASSSVDRNQILLADLTRSIDNNVVELVGSLGRSVEVVRRREEAARRQEEAWGSTQELRRAGDISLLDLIATEQQLTSTRLELVRARREHASLLARLRHEIGSLVEFPGEGSQEEAVSFEVLGLVVEGAEIASSAP